MQGELIGELNFLPAVSASGQAISFKNCDGVQYVGTATTDTETFTVTASATYGGTYSDAAVITRYYTNASQVLADSWATDSGDVTATDSVTCAAASAVTFYIDAADLQALGYNYAKVTSSGSGTATLYAVARMNPQRQPIHLAVMSGTGS